MLIRLTNITAVHGTPNGYPAHSFWVTVDFSQALIGPVVQSKFAWMALVQLFCIQWACVRHLLHAHRLVRDKLNQDHWNNSRLNNWTLIVTEICTRNSTNFITRPIVRRIIYGKKQMPWTKINTWVSDIITRISRCLS